MSGGIAYVLDENGRLRREALQSRRAWIWSRSADARRHRALLHDWIARHVEATGSPRAKWILENWETMLPQVRQSLPARVQARSRRAPSRPQACASRKPIAAATAGGSWVRSPASWNTRESCRQRRPVAERVKDWFEIYQPFPEEKLRTQGARCMDCGVPFCHTGCPVNNIIPDWNDLVYRGRWQEAIRVCTPPTISRSSPAASAPRRAKRPACWASTSRRSPSSRSKRRSSTARSTKAGSCPSRPTRAPASASRWSDRDRPAWPPRSNWPRRARSHACLRRTTASADCCATAFRISRWRSTLIDRRMRADASRRRAIPHQCACRPQRPGGRSAQGVRRHPAGRRRRKPRDLQVPGRELKGIHFAMEFLPQQNRRCEGDDVSGTRSWRPASAWSSSAAATPARLPGHLPPAEGASPFISSR